MIGFGFVDGDVLGEFGEVFPVHILDESSEVSQKEFVEEKSAEVDEGDFPEKLEVEIVGEGNEVSCIISVLLKK